MFPVLPLALIFFTAITGTASVSSDCNDFTFDKCTLKDDAVIETVKDVSQSDCQFYCNVIYNTTCKFFIHDKQQATCTLVKEEIQTYVNTCRKMGGPVIPSVHDCKESQDICKVFFPSTTTKI